MEHLVKMRRLIFVLSIDVEIFAAYQVQRNVLQLRSRFFLRALGIDINARVCEKTLNDIDFGLPGRPDGLTHLSMEGMIHQ